MGCTDVDAVVIATPSATHTELALATLAAREAPVPREAGRHLRVGRRPARLACSLCRPGGRRRLQQAVPPGGDRGAASVGEGGARSHRFDPCDLRGADDRANDARLEASARDRRRRAARSRLAPRRCDPPSPRTRAPSRGLRAAIRAKRARRLFTPLRRRRVPGDDRLLLRAGAPRRHRARGRTRANLEHRPLRGHASGSGQTDVERILAPGACSRGAATTRGPLVPARATRVREPCSRRVDSRPDAGRRRREPSGRPRRRVARSVMRVLLVNDWTATGGGVERYVLDAAAGLRSAGDDVHLLAADTGDAADHADTIVKSSDRALRAVGHAGGQSVRRQGGSLAPCAPSGLTWHLSRCSR